jgi:hypothetical protein
MAHSHHHHREHQVSHRRVHHILKHEPDGAKQHAHRHAFSKITSKTAAEHHDAQVSGKKAVKRYKRGGKVKGHQTNIAIVMPHHQGAPSPGGPGPMAGPPPGLPPGLGGGPGGPPPPGAGPGGPPMPPPMMHKRGGKVIDGESTKADIKKWGKRAKSESYARGGAAWQTAGAATGVGREEQARHMKKKGK